MFLNGEYNKKTFRGLGDFADGSRALGYKLGAKILVKPSAHYQANQMAKDEILPRVGVIVDEADKFQDSYKNGVGFRWIGQEQLPDTNYWYGLSIEGQKYIDKRGMRYIIEILPPNYENEIKAQLAWIASLEAAGMYSEALNKAKRALSLWHKLLPDEIAPLKIAEQSVLIGEADSIGVPSTSQYTYFKQQLNNMIPLTDNETVVLKEMIRVKKAEPKLPPPSSNGTPPVPPLLPPPTTFTVGTTTFTAPSQPYIPPPPPGTEPPKVEGGLIPGVDNSLLLYGGLGLGGVLLLILLMK